MINNRPNFIIVGTMKSGTSSLMHHLGNHKDIHIPDYELHFFNRDKNFKKGKEWYEKKLADENVKGAKILGEKTPTYSYQKNVAERIYKSYPNVKLIWVFRDPVARTYSNYLHAVRTGAERLSFRKAIDSEDERKEDNIFLAYTERSIYHKQLNHFLEYFAPEQMHYILFEELIEPYDQNKVFPELFNFLDVDSARFEYKNEVKNKTLKPRFPFSYIWARKLNVYRSGVVQEVLNFMNFKGRTKTFEPIPIDIKKELYDFFKPHNKKLSELINKDLSIWEPKE